VVKKPERETPHGKPRHGRKDNIKIDVQEMGWETWMGLFWLRIGTSGGLL
jgi:hypothetical protein